MKFVYLVPIVFLLGLTVHDSFAQIYHGSNYDEEILNVYQDGNIIKLIKKWTTTPEKILINNQYVNYRLTDTGNVIRLETGHGSVELNKSSCSFNFYKKGVIDSLPLFTDSIVPKIANIGTENWNELSVMSNASCEAYGDSNQLVAKKFVSGVGLMEYKYINNGHSWKTQLEVTNLSSNTNKKFGFTQTIDLNRDTVEFGGVTRNLDNFNAMTFDRTWLVTNKAKVITFLNDVSFDFDLGFNNLNSVYVLDTGANKSKLVFNYLYNQNVIMPNEKLIIDPTYAYTAASTETRIQTNNAAGAACPSSSYSVYGGGEFTFLGTSGGVEQCIRTVLEWNTTSIPNNSVISAVNLRYDVTATPYNTRNCDFNAMDVARPSTSGSPGDLYLDAGNGTTYVDNSASCTTIANDKVVSLGSTAAGDLQGKLAVDWFALGVKLDNEARDANNYGQSEAGGLWELEVTYEQTLVSISGLTCNGLPYGYSCSWSIVNGSAVTGYYIQTSTNNSTWYGGNQTLISNTTSGSITGVQYGVNEPNFVRVNGTYGGTVNGTSSNVVSVNTDNVPDAPSITATASSKTQINIVRTAGSSDGGDIVDDYNLQASVNGAAFADLVTNSTIVSFYNHTGLASGDSVVYRWRDGNDVGWSSYSSNSTAETYQTTSGTLTFTSSNVGDMFLFNGTLSNITASPNPATATQVAVIDNGSVVATKTISNSLPDGSSASITFIPYLITDDNAHPIKLRLTATNDTGTVTIDSAVTNVTREYDPDYFEAIDPTQGYVNYTISRTSDQDEINLKTNREENGTSFQIECRYRSMTDAALNSGGTWHNYTGVYFMNDTLTDAAGTHYYIDCYNDGLLFQVVSYTNSSMLLAGIEVFDDTYGTFIGVPVGVFFIVLVAGMANQRTAPMWIIVILAIAGIMSTIGFFTLETNVWALALIAALLGIIVGRKLF